jgi:hypothetical protein
VGAKFLWAQRDSVDWSKKVIESHWLRVGCLVVARRFVGDGGRSEP